VHREQIARALPKHHDAERFCRIAITATTRTPKLMECTPASVMKCLLDLSAMGLEPDGRRAHLIPYGTECTLIIDYKGTVELVRRDPSVEDVQCITIRENDAAEWVNGEMIHKIDPKSDRGEVVCTYTRIKWKSGAVSVGEPFSKADAEHAKKSSKTSSSGPWKDHYTEMWKKSNIKRDSKMWPLSPEIRDALDKDDEHAFAPRNVTPRPGFAAALAAPVEPTSQESFEAELAQEEEAQ
jgi:recombination protein RecT